MIITGKITPYTEDRLFLDSTEQKIKQLESDFEELNVRLNKFDVNSVISENIIKEENVKKLQELKNEVHDRIDNLQSQIDWKGNSIIEEKLSKQEKLVKLALISRFI